MRDGKSRLMLSAVVLVGVAVMVLGVIELARRRHARLNAPTFVQDLAAWDRAMPYAKPRQIFTGTQPVNRKALARTLKAKKPLTRPTVRRLRVVPDLKKRLG